LGEKIVLQMAHTSKLSDFRETDSNKVPLKNQIIGRIQGWPTPLEVQAADNNFH
jgi:hypothetical protein